MGNDGEGELTGRCAASCSCSSGEVCGEQPAQDWLLVCRGLVVGKKQARKASRYKYHSQEPGN